MITPNGGVFGRNPTFNNVTVENNLTVNGDFTLGDDIVINDTLLVNGVATFRGGIISIPNSAAPTSNTVIGSGAGAALQAGATDNVLIGLAAGDAITTGDQSVAVGTNALGANQTANNCVAVGHAALLLNTASDITAVGANALDANTTGARNVAVGKDALGANTSAADNVAVGHNALSSMQGVLSGNVAIGTNALAANVGNVSDAPIGSVAIGLDAARFLTTGSRNVAVGATAMNNATTARACTAVGPGAMRDGTGGLYNTAIGSASGQSLTGAANSCFGSASGTNLTSGNFNVVLGGADTDQVTGTGTTLTTGSANILIGRVDVPSGSTSNSIVIAGRSYGAQWVGDGSNTTVIGNTDTTSTRIPAGNLTLTNGNFIVGTSGKGIDFSATSDGTGTMTSELLSDYEEGTWTPTVSFGGNSVGVTYANQDGRYTKVGRLVNASCYVTLSNKGSSTGTALIGGLPFAIASGNASYSAGSIDAGNITFSGTMTPVANIGNSTLYLNETTTAGVRTQVVDTDFANNSLFIMSISYTV